MNEYGAQVEWYWQAKPKCSEKNLSTATMSTTISTWTDLGLNPGFHIDRLAANCWAMTWPITYTDFVDRQIHKLMHGVSNCVRVHSTLPVHSEGPTLEPRLSWLFFVSFQSPQLFCFTFLPVYYCPDYPTIGHYIAQATYCIFNGRPQVAWKIHKQW
jgi:hypothetical protein